MSTLEDWTETVIAELGIGDLVDAGTRDLVLDLARDVAHGVARPAAPLTAYLLGLAVGRGADPTALADRLATLATGWSPAAVDPAPAGSATGAPAAVDVDPAAADVDPAAGAPAAGAPAGGAGAG